MENVDKAVESIVKFCEDNKHHVCSQFVPELTDEDYLLTLDPDNWRNNFWSDDGEIYGFDCEPFDSQLRAYVSTRDWQCKSVQGE